jgi:hypothetical protein
MLVVRMFRGWTGLALVIGAAVVLFAGAVLYAVQRPSVPHGYSGLEFAPMSAAAQARTPLLPSGGALIARVYANSPAAGAGIKSGDVAARIDGKKVRSADQAARLVRAASAGKPLAMVLYGVADGFVHPRAVTITPVARPDTPREHSVRPPRTLAKPRGPAPVVAANAAWSRRIRRGPTIQPDRLYGVGWGDCNGFAPQGWHVEGHAADGSFLSVAANQGFYHAVYKAAQLDGISAPDYIRTYLSKTFGAPARLAPRQTRPHGFVQYDFGNTKGGAGFVIARVTKGRIALWIAAVPSADVGWAKGQAGSVALSLTCNSAHAPAPRPRTPDLAATHISLACIRGKCSETDFAATYLSVLHKGYVHNAKGEMFLVNPRRDLWQNGAEGPGFYHQQGGRNEKLEPGRLN